MKKLPYSLYMEPFATQSVPAIVIIGMTLTFGFTGCASKGSHPEAQQEKSMQERILERPDQSRVSRYDGQAFLGDSRFQSRTYSSRTYQGAKTANTGSFFTRLFKTDKAARSGKSASTLDSSYVVPTSPTFNQSTPKSAFSTSAYRRANQQTQVKPGVVKTPSTKIEAQAQGRLDSMSKEMKERMTIDEVREMLNKPK